MISPANDMVGPERSSQRGQDGAGLFIYRVDFGHIRFTLDEEQSIRGNRRCAQSQCFGGKLEVDVVRVEFAFDNRLIGR